jgi:hypothetical protein
VLFRSPDQKTKLERVASACPVHRSLLPEIEHDVQFVYSE